MKEQEKSEERLDSYFDLARKEEPIVRLEDVTMPFTRDSAPASNVAGGKRNGKYLLIISALIISAFTAIYLNSSSPTNTNESVAENSQSVEQQEKEIATKSSTTINTSTIADAEKSNAESNNSIIEKENTKKTPNRENSNFELLQVNKKKTTYYFPGNAEVNFEDQGRKITMKIGDKVNQLTIDGKIIDAAEYNNYQLLIERGLLMSKNSTEIGNQLTTNRTTNKAKNKLIMDSLIEELKNDKLIQTEAHFEFRLTGQSLFINEIKHDDRIYKKYKELYQTLSGNRVIESTNIRIKH